MADVRTSTGGTYHLTREEMETTISWNEATDKATIDTWSPALIRKMEKLVAEFPDKVKAVYRDNYAPRFIIDKKYISVRTPKGREMSEEQKALAGERMRQYRASLVEKRQ